MAVQGESERRREVIEALEEMMDDYPTDAVVDACGYSSRVQLRMQLKRWGRPDLAAKIPSKTSEERRADVASEVERLIGLRDPEDIAVALGYHSASSLDRALRRWGYSDLARRLAEDSDRDDTGRFILHTLGRIR